MVIFEEKGGDPTQIRFSRRKLTSLCAHVSEDHPSFSTNNLQKNIASLEIKCPMNMHISAFKFASYGTPTGTCDSYSVGNCHDPDSTFIVEKVIAFPIHYRLIFQCLVVCGLQFFYGIGIFDSIPWRVFSWQMDGIQFHRDSSISYVSISTFLEEGGTNSFPFSFFYEKTKIPSLYI